MPQRVGQDPAALAYAIFIFAKFQGNCTNAHIHTGEVKNNRQYLNPLYKQKTRAVLEFADHRNPGAKILLEPVLK